MDKSLNPYYCLQKSDIIVDRMQQILFITSIELQRHLHFKHYFPELSEFRNQTLAIIAKF